MKILKSGAAALVLALLVACSQANLYTPLPADKMQYAGEWKGGGIRLVIDPGGRVVYESKGDGMSKSIDSPLKEFKGDDFVVGLGFLNTEFKVSAPPHEDDGVWKMTVDGVELVRTPTGV